ncbi:MAG: hypothetical protein JSU00_23745 [Acidobacteria bacterium]|nr:hypothetical protein [Acidobacteriota bacterium]
MDRPSASPRGKLYPRAPDCPQCGSDDVRPSTPTFVSRLLILIFLRPFRCRRCRTRFYRFRVVPVDL